MPFYDLRCKGCDKEFNTLASMRDREESRIQCPECGSSQLETVFKNVNVIQSRKSQGSDCPHAHQCGGCCHH